MTGYKTYSGKKRNLQPARPSVLSPALPTPPDPIGPRKPALPDLPDYIRPASDGDRFGDIRFRQLLGEQEWRKLPQTLRRRFAKKIEAGGSVTYQGQIVETRMTWIGHLLAQTARLFGAPLPLDAGNAGMPAIVTVTEEAHGAGQFWTRTYGRKGKFPQVISSAKFFNGVTGLEEQVGGGVGLNIGMALKLETRWRKLLFISNHYFLKAFGRRVRLPDWLTPGKLTVGHEDLSNGRFSFTLTIDHTLFGRILYQQSVFQDPAPLNKETCHG